MTCYVYLIRAGDFIKIGHAKDPENRLAGMQTGSPHQLDLIAKMPFQTKLIAHEYELELHRRLADFHYRGEWFREKCIELAFRAPKPLLSKKQSHAQDDIVTPIDSRWRKGLQV